jgi:hypothetical protein
MCSSQPTHSDEARCDHGFGLVIAGIIDRSLKELFTLVECSLPLMIALLLGDGVGLWGRSFGQSLTCFLCWMLGFVTLDPAHAYLLPDFRKSKKITMFFGSKEYVL